MLCKDCQHYHDLLDGEDEQGLYQVCAFSTNGSYADCINEQTEGCDSFSDKE
jgi:hypothetical protein